MAIYNAPLRDMSFLLNDVLQIDKYANLPGFADATPDLISAILEEGAKIAQEVLQPLNQVGDKEGCHLIDGEVKTPTGFKGAYDTFVQGGWSGLTAEPEYGGQGLPNVVGVVVNEMVASANMAFGMYPGLTGTAYSAILIHGSDAQKQTYLSKMISGQWSGTMNLTEPHCGTDLGLMRTKAEPQDDGSYKISGTKIFVSAGEHDLTEVFRAGDAPSPQHLARQQAPAAHGCFTERPAQILATDVTVQRVASGLPQGGFHGRIQRPTLPTIEQLAKVDAFARHVAGHDLLRLGHRTVNGLDGMLELLANEREGCLGIPPGTPGDVLQRLCGWCTSLPQRVSPAATLPAAIDSTLLPRRPLAPTASTATATAPPLASPPLAACTRRHVFL